MNKAKFSVVAKVKGLEDTLKFEVEAVDMKSASKEAHKAIRRQTTRKWQEIHISGKT